MLIKRRIKSRKRNYILFLMFLFNLLIILSIFVSITPNKLVQKENFGKLHISGQVPHEDIQWLENANFTTQGPWYSSKQGDLSDVDAKISGGHANYFILGDQGEFSNISGTPTSDNWKNVTNANFPISPILHEIDEEGCHVYHTWQDPTDPFQMTSIHWDRNITLPVDMTDYNITSVSLSATVNATVTPFGTTPLYQSGVDVEGDTIDGSSPDFSREYDYVRFYVLISDLQKKNVYEVAYNQTKNLGQDSPTISNMTDTEMFIIPKESIISFLTTVFENDPDHRSFTLTLGIRIYCADNGMGDNDTWNSLRIKSCNLAFTYEKIINQFTSVSWEQVGDQITGENVQITNARLNFDYKINKTWPYTSSPNSEIRILINDKQYAETLKLSTASLSFQEAKLGGFDVTPLINPYINISVSIRLFIGDEFGLNQEINVSIDNVFLEISYIEIFSEVISEPLIFRVLLIVAVVGSIILGSYLVLYQKILKYPKPVRKVRKYKRTLRRKQNPSTTIISRKEAIDALFNKELSQTTKFTKGKPTEQKVKPTKKPSLAPKKLSSKKVDKTSENLVSKAGTNIYRLPTKRKNQKRSEKLRPRKHIFKKLKFYKHQKFLILILILLILLINPFMLIIGNIQNYSEFQNDKLNFKETQNHEILHLSSETRVSDQWLKNSEFDTSEHWNLLKGEEGDKNDVDGIINQGQADYEILGEIRTFSNISGTPNSSEWTRVANPNFPDFPDTAEIRDDGCYVSHEWTERSDQSPCVHWDRNVTMPVNMSDYIITSVSLTTVVNATVEASGGGSGGIEVPGDTVTDFASYDYVRFYVLFSDLSADKVYEVAYNQTRNLGDDGEGTRDYMSNTNLTNIPQDKLIEYLTSALRTDDRHFKITLGIRIWCEDNFNWDEDDWESLWIKSCNLTFTYERKIDRFTSVSWNQVGDKISGENVQITGANLKFKYKIDQLWPTLYSPNSEIRILINDNHHTETIKLSSVTTSFQEANIEGYDVTSLISKDVNVSLSIQVFLADIFGLNRTVTVSIDDVFLEISLIITSPEEVFEPWIFTALLVVASTISAAVAGYLYAYQKVLKYPRQVRKVRKFRKTLRKKSAPDVIIIDRERAFSRAYRRELSGTAKFIKTKPSEISPPKKIASKAQEPKLEQEQLISKSIEKKEELDKLIKDPSKNVK